MTSRPNIPIQNIYYLLAYAWDQFEAGEEQNISDTDSVNGIPKVQRLGIP